MSHAPARGTLQSSCQGSSPPLILDPVARLNCSGRHSEFGEKGALHVCFGGALTSEGRCETDVRQGSCGLACNEVAE
eukprot:13165882-Alexandrium_andersonii.AAC.1